MSCIAITTSSSNLLHVALETLGQVVVYDSSHISLVKSHSEGHRCHDNAKLAGHEGGLDASALGC